MKKYECVKGFMIPKCDDNGFILEDEDVQIEAGTVWYDVDEEEEEYRFIGGEVRLEDENGTWIEISEEDLSASFKELT